MATVPTRELSFLSAETLAGLIRRRALSPVELMEATLARIAALNPTLNAFVQLDPERGLAEARAQTERLAKGEDLGPLGGLPFGVKELENAAGFRTTAGSRLYRDRMAARDDVHVERLRRAGAICIGKTNSPEFGYTAFTTNELFGTTRNPWNLDRTPGGSSGGAAAAIAAGMVAVATASDGGGSIRIPACFVGAFGHKPTFGLVPIGPRDMLGWTDTSVYGPLTRTVRDAALYLDQVAGYHPADPTSVPRPVASYLAALDQPLPPLRIAFNRHLSCPKVQADVLREVERAAAVFQELGHEVEENDDRPPDMAGYWVAMGRFQSLAAMYDEVLHRPQEFSPAYYAGFEVARQVGPTHFRDAYRARARLADWLWHLFERYDLLLTPTMPVEAFDAAGPIPREVDGVPLGGGIIAFTAPFNFSGHPAATVRAGFTDAGLPAGLQIVGERYRDHLVLRAAFAYEQARPWHDRWPDL
jgi:Asp-tRNA(Asn)/Glu-tRNA(Gln) amidotransferase A subunit family amidase